LPKSIHPLAEHVTINNKIGIMQRRKELQMGILYLHQTLSRREFTMEVVVWNPSTRFFTNAFHIPHRTFDFLCRYKKYCQFCQKSSETRMITDFLKADTVRIPDRTDTTVVVMQQIKLPTYRTIAAD
jgi:hypothetical protein